MGCSDCWESLRGTSHPSNLMCSIRDSLVVHYKNNSKQCLYLLDKKHFSCLFMKYEFLWITPYQLLCYPQKFCNRASYSWMEDSSSSHLSPCLSEPKMVDFYQFLIVINRNMTSLLLRLYIYKIFKEQLKANPRLFNVRGFELPSIRCLKDSLQRGRVGKKGFRKIGASELKNLA